MIRTAIRYQNNMVMVFDKKGEQIPKYQGQYADVKGSVLRDAPPDAGFAHWFGDTAEPEAVSKDNW